MTGGVHEPEFPGCAEAALPEDELVHRSLPSDHERLEDPVLPYRFLELPEPDRVEDLPRVPASDLYPRWHQFQP